MTFITPLLALGALAFAIPLIIHLLHRSRFTTVDWGAWQLLDSVVRINRRRMQMTNLLLLLLRCLIPILLAFCIARPVFTGFRSLPGDDPQSLVIALDDSRSMDAAANGQPSRIEQAKQGIIEQLRKMSRRDEVILLRSSRIDAPPESMGVSEAIKQIQKIRAVSGPVDLSRIADAAAQAAAQGSHAQRRILFVSDFQSNSIATSSLDSISRIGARIAEQQPAPVVSFWNVANDSSTLSNVSVDSVTVDSPAVVAGRNSQFSARIRNSSDDPVRDLRVIWSVDGMPLDPRLGTIDARSTSTARLSHRIDEPGVHEVTVTVEHADALASDNRRSIGVDVMREIAVLLVDGKPSSKPLEGQADFLAIALSPFAFGGDDQPDSVSAAVINQREIVKTLEAETPELIVLANVTSISNEDKNRLASFVNEGGSLVVFDGDRVKPTDYNQAWKFDEGQLEFPAMMGNLKGDPDSRKQNAKTDVSSDKPPMRIGELNPLFSAWGLLAPGDQRPLSEVDVFAYRKFSIDPPKVDETGQPLQDQDAAESNGESTVLLRMTNGDPIVVSARRGRGQVVQFALPCNASWSSLPLRMIYLPMMQQLVLDLAGRRKTTTLNVGQPIAVPTSELSLAAFYQQSEGSTAERKQRVAEQEKNAKYTIESPLAGEVEISRAAIADDLLRWTATSEPGVVHFRRAVSDKEENTSTEVSAESQIAQTIRVMEVPEEESQLRDTDPQRLSSVAASLDAEVYTDSEALQEDDRTRRYGREIWRWLLAILLVGMIAELFLQQSLISRRIVAGPTS